MRVSFVHVEQIHALLHVTKFLAKGFDTIRYAERNQTNLLIISYWLIDPIFFVESDNDSFCV